LLIVIERLDTFPGHNQTSGRPGVNALYPKGRVPDQQKGARERGPGRTMFYA
jgi:hypothetical protein